MTIADLVSLGKLGNSKLTSEGFLRFKPDWNFQFFFLDIKDVFLVFPDHRVRYVTIEEVKKDRLIWIKLKEKDVYEEIEECRRVSLCLPQSDIISARYQHDPDFLSGMKVIYQNQELGTVTESVFNGAHYNLTVKCDNGREFSVPQVEHYVKEFNKEEKIIVLQNIDGLMDL